MDNRRRSSLSFPILWLIYSLTEILLLSIPAILSGLRTDIVNIMWEARSELPHKQVVGLRVPARVSSSFPILNSQFSIPLFSHFPSWETWYLSSIFCSIFVARFVTMALARGTGGSWPGHATLCGTTSAGIGFLLHSKEGLAWLLLPGTSRLSAMCPEIW